MKDYKLKVLNELEKLTADYHSAQLRRAALNAGVNHLKTQECFEILNAFIKLHPDFKIYQYLQTDNDKASCFCSLFVTDNETPPLDENTRV